MRGFGPFCATGAPLARRSRDPARMTTPTAASAFPHLFSPITIGSVTIRNRILSSGHDTVMAVGGLITDQLIAYQEARARGGAGLIDPCGVPGLRSTSIAAELGRRADPPSTASVEAAARVFAPALAQRMDADLVWSDEDPGATLVAVGAAEHEAAAEAETAAEAEAAAEAEPAGSAR